MKISVALLLMQLYFCCVTIAQSISSPNRQYVVSIDGLTYSVSFKNKVVVETSRLGVDIDNRLFESALAVPRGNYEDWSSDLTLKSVDSVCNVDNSWQPLYGENSLIRNHYNEITLHYEKGSNGQDVVFEGYDKRKYYAMDIIVRAYDEGIAFRYHFPETSNSLFLHIVGEQTSFTFPTGTQAWYEEWAQAPYEKRLLKGNWYESERPLLLQTTEGLWVALLEAELTNYCRGKFKLKREYELQISLYDCADVITPYDTPWRVIMVGEKATDLINHKDLILNLNQAHKETDWSWVKPGKAFRSSKLTKASIMQSIDYCKQLGFDYVELDAGWYGPEGKVASDARRVSDNRDFSMPEICQYAQSNGIGVWIYINQRALYQQLDELLPLCQKWGISGIKFGFVQVGNQMWTTWLHKAIAKCAQYGIMVDIHDEYRPTGFSRTYPNLLTQEGICGNEEMPDANHNTLLPFTRFLCGPADYTLCYFNSRIKNTKGHQLAMAAVFYSPLQFYFWYDNPFVDKGEDELNFWKQCPTVFDKSIALDGIPGQYIIQARCSGTEWFVGALNNTEARNLTIPTNFLSAKKYQVDIYNDDPTLTTRTKILHTIVKIEAGKPINIYLQASGGAALHFKPIE